MAKEDTNYLLSTLFVPDTPDAPVQPDNRKRQQQGLEGPERRNPASFFAHAEGLAFAQLADQLTVICSCK